METETLILKEIQVPLTASQFLAKYIIESPDTRAPLLTEFLEPYPRLSATDAHMMIRAIIRDEWVGPSAVAKLALADILCKFPVPADATFVELYKLYTLLHYRLYHQGIHTYLFGLNQDKDNYGFNSALCRALKTPSVPDGIEAGSNVQLHRLVEASQIPGASIFELLVMLGYVVGSCVSTYYQTSLFKQIRRGYSVDEISRIVNVFINNQVLLTPKMFKCFVESRIIEPLNY